MVDYRVYFLDLSGHFRRAQPLQAPDDNAAVQQALSIAENDRWELWSGARMVGGSENYHRQTG